jgi:hypothetical protein
MRRTFAALGLTVTLLGTAGATALAGGGLAGSQAGPAARATASSPSPECPDPLIVATCFNADGTHQTCCVEPTS